MLLTFWCVDMLSDNAFSQKLWEEYDVDHKLVKKLKEKIFHLLERAMFNHGPEEFHIKVTKTPDESMPTG